MPAQPQLSRSERRPPHIRYFEVLQIAMIGIALVTQLTGGRERLLFNLATLAPAEGVLLGLTLAVSRGRQNWARWVLLVLYIYVAISVVTFSFMSGAQAAVVGGVLSILPGAVLALAFTKQSSAWLRAKRPQSGLMSAARPIERRPRFAISGSLDFGERPGPTWTVMSGVGAALGAWIACLLFPSARFAENLIGHFSWALVGFASTVGLGFGAAQAATLMYLAKSAEGLQLGRIRLVALGWIVATAAGVFVMIFPLWWTYAEALLLAPGYMLAVMMPGILTLAILQWALLRSCSPVRGWLWRTAVGGAIGGSMGLMAATIVGGLLPLPIEVAWTGSFGLLIGAMQAKPVRDLRWASGAFPKQEFAPDTIMSPAPPISKPVRQS